MKNAKKSMFITTILMVAVLIVAVSTATFAWYTATGNPTASQASLVAADSTAANVAIGWNASATGSHLTFATDAVTVDPMAPTTVPTIGSTTYANFGLETATLDINNKFNGTAGQPAGTAADPWVVDGEDKEGDYFYVVNRNVNQGVDLLIEIAFANNVADDPDVDGDQSISYDNNNKLVVAVFVNNTLAGIFTGTGLTEGYAAGAIVGGADGSLTPTKQGVVQNITIELAANNNAFNNADASAKIQVKAWIDGNALTQEFANGKAAFSFTFSAQ